MIQPKYEVTRVEESTSRQSKVFRTMDAMATNRELYDMQFHRKRLL